MTRERLIHLSLTALHETVEEARKRPVKGTVGLRLALAYLYSQSDRKNRQVFDEFWRLVVGLDAHPGKQPDYIRGTSACTSLQSICRAVKVNYGAFVDKLGNGALTDRV